MEHGTIDKITLRAARTNAGYTQQEIADKLGVSNKTVVNWETGKVKPSFSVLYTLSGLYKIPMDCIILPNKSTESKLEEK